MHGLCCLVVAASACRGADRETPPAPSPAPRPALTPPRARHQAPEQPAAHAAFYRSTFAKKPTVADMTALGAQIFRDPSLSASGQLACATCHDPANAFAPSTKLAVQRGGATGAALGVRAAPSLRYLAAIPRFTEHFHDGDDDGIDQGPAGGLTWDGRADSMHEQAKSPLFSPLEMANHSADELAGKLRHTSYAAAFVTTFGAGALDTTDSALKAATLALEVYQQDPATFYPYSSKFDAVLRGTAKLSPTEARGKQIFDDPKRGNCATCHPDTIKSGFPAFTDFGFIALGVPRNRSLPTTRDPAYFDLGLCGPYRTDLSARSDYCGMFRTPSLRNVTSRKRFMHNGELATLHDVLEFYATRDVTPARWYRGGQPFDDLPAEYQRNVNRDAPFGPTRVLSEADIADITAFLATLTDADVGR